MEVTDLTEEQQQQLWRETAAVSSVIQKLPGVKKLNVAAIGEASYQTCSRLCAMKFHAALS